MSLSNTAVPIYYGQFREAVLRKEIPVCREIAMEIIADKVTFLSSSRRKEDEEKK